MHLQEQNLAHQLGDVHSTGDSTCQPHHHLDSMVGLCAYGASSSPKAGEKGCGQAWPYCLPPTSTS